MNDILVSISCVTYNHEKYISQAIESFLNQKTTFSFEIIIHDDASTDNTVEIIKEYSKKYNDLIIPIYQEENQYSKGVSPISASYIFPRVRGKYIALCDGDDYWTSPYKLQKQVDVMEKNENISLCFHNAEIIWQNQNIKSSNFCSKNIPIITKTEDVIRNCYIPTSSVMIRKKNIINIPKWIYGIYNADWAIQLLSSTKGEIYFCNNAMSVYRKSEKGFSGRFGRNIYFINQQKIRLLNFFNDFTSFNYNKIIQEKIVELTEQIDIYNKNKKFRWLKIFNVKKILNFIKKIVVKVV